jgi:hypothetical protein
MISNGYSSGPGWTGQEEGCHRKARTGGNDMVIPDFAFSLVIALLFSLIFAAIIRRRGPRAGFFWFFMLILLTTWAGGIWARPLGPAIWGVNWLAFLVVGLIVAMLVTITAYREGPERPYVKVERDAQFSRAETQDLLARIDRNKSRRQMTYVTLSVFYWLLLLMLILAIISRYVVQFGR